MENKNFRLVSFQPNVQKKIKKKKAKKFKKLTNTVMDSFQAKIGWKKMRQRENKNYSSVSFLSGTIQKIKKKKQKIQKFKKYHYGFISIQNRLEKAEKNRK